MKSARTGIIKQSDKILPIIEMYECLQQEGKLSGIPHLLIRFTGCTHRCYFGENNWCDTWYTSIHPVKGIYTLTDVKRKIYDYEHDHIMLTGGSPSMHKTLLTTLLNYCYDLNKFVTVETEGSFPIESTYKVDLISLSVKFDNSIPVKGTKTPTGKIVDNNFIKTHNKYRQNDIAIKNAIRNHTDYQFKPVCDGTAECWSDIISFINKWNIPADKVWIMPAGSTRQQLLHSYPIIMDQTQQHGYNFSGRNHIIAYDIQKLK